MSDQITTPAVEESNNAAVQTITPNQNDTINNSDDTSTATTANLAPTTFTISNVQYMQFLAAQRTAREYTLAKKMKEHNAIFSARRITVATRRIDLKAIAPDLDVLAYIELCKMKEAIGQDATASDPEIAAYVEIWNVDGEITLDAINQKLQNATP